MLQNEAPNCRLACPAARYLVKHPTIDELPPGRTPVTTAAIPDMRRSDIIDHVRNACTHEGRQAYWGCTLIEESELLEAQAAEAKWEELTLAELNVGLVHGRMKPAVKQAVM